MSLDEKQVYLCARFDLSAKALGLYTGQLVFKVLAKAQSISNTNIFLLFEFPFTNCASVTTETEA